MNYRQIATASFAAATITLVACGGGHMLPSSGGGATPSKPATMTKATLRVLIPKRNASSLRRPAFVSKSTKAIVVAVFTSPYNNGAVPTASGTFDVSSTSTSCTPDVSSGGSQCTFSLSVPSGTDDFLVTTYDTAPVNNAIPAGAARLGYGRVSNVHVVAGADNQIPLALGGVVAQVALAMQVPATPDPNWSCNPTGTACTLPHVSNLVSKTVTVSALDAKGNTIVSDGWIDADGNPVSITISADTSANPANTPAPLGFNTPGPSASPSASPIPTGTPASTVSFSGPDSGGNSFTMTFDPSKLSFAQMTAGFGTLANSNEATITAQASNSVSTTATVRLVPPLVEFSPVPAPPGQTSVSNNAMYMRASADNKLWIGENGLGSIVSVDISNPFSPVWSTAYAANPLPTSAPSANPNYLAAPEELLPVGSPATTAVWFIEKGSPSATNPSKIAKMSLPAPSGVPYMTETSLGIGTLFATGIAQASDGSFWITVGGSGGAKVVRFDPGTSTVTTPTLTGGTMYANGTPNDIVAAAGKLWTADSQAPSGITAANLYEIDPIANTLTPHPLPTTGSLGIGAITFDSSTGRLWIGEKGSLVRLTYYDTNTGQWAVDSYPESTATSRLSGSVEQIIVARDGTVWATEANSGKIAHLVLGANPPSTAVVTELNGTGTSKTTWGIVSDPISNPYDGSVWYTEYGTNSLAHLYP